MDEKHDDFKEFFGSVKFEKLCDTDEPTKEEKGFFGDRELIEEELKKVTKNFSKTEKAAYDITMYMTTCDLSPAEAIEVLSRLLDAQVDRMNVLYKIEKKSPIESLDGIIDFFLDKLETKSK